MIPACLQSRQDKPAPAKLFASRTCDKSYGSIPSELACSNFQWSGVI
jgi:hypothetical protein